MSTPETTRAAELPKPGIYKGIPFADYLAWPAISNSRISLARKSMRHFRDVKFTESTPALRLGSFVHCGVLEPMAVVRRYVVMPDFEKDAENMTADGVATCSKNTKYYKAKVAAYQSVNADKSIVGIDEYERLCGISNALSLSKTAREYLSEQGEAEVSLVWEDAETGLPCKARIDWLNSGITDLKTTIDGAAFNRSIAKYGYHRQGSHYQTGLATLTGGEIKPFRLIAVESSQPFGVRAAPLNDDAIEAGCVEVRQALRDIARARELNFYPCYDDPSSWCLPSWYAAGRDELEVIVGGETISL